MKVLATNLPLSEATQMIKGTDLAMYRMTWIEEDGLHPAQVALGYDEDGDLYDIAEDESYVIALEDVLAEDWVVISVEDGETIENKEHHDHELFDEAVLDMLHAFRKMQGTHTNVPRTMLFARIGQILSNHLGNDKLEEFLKTGVLTHNDKCECPSCEEARFNANPEAFTKGKLQGIFEGLAELLEKESKEKEDVSKTGLDFDGDSIEASGEDLLGLLEFLGTIASKR